MASSPDGGIGRRAGLKHQWGNPCRFDPGSGYAIIKDNDLNVMLNELSFFLFVTPHNVPYGRQFIKTNTYLCNALRQTTYSLPAVLNSYHKHIHLYYKYA